MALSGTRDAGRRGILGVAYLHLAFYLSELKDVEQFLRLATAVSDWVHGDIEALGKRVLDAAQRVPVVKLYALPPLQLDVARAHALSSGG